MNYIIPTLETAQLVTAGVPVPGLSAALAIALSIAKKAKEIKAIRDDCRALAERAADFALAVYQQLKSCSGGTGTKDHVMTLLRNLEAIENLVDRRLRAGKRERILFALNHGKIAKDVRDLTTKLEDCYRTFMIQAALDNDYRMDMLTSGNIRIMQHIDDSAHVGDATRVGLSNLAQHPGCSAVAFDGNFRLFARENLDFLEPMIDLDKPPRAPIHHQAAPYLARVTAAQQTGRVFRYRAIVRAAGELTDTHVVVHTYPDRDDAPFLEALRVAKQSCHPYLLAVLGYSRPGNPGEASYIVMEDYCPLVEYLRFFGGVRKLQVLLEMTASACMAVDHLEVTGLRRMLSLKDYSSITRRYAFGLGELVYDHRRGGRIKWARHSLSIGDSSDRAQSEVPAVPTDRASLVEDLRPAAGASADVVARVWFSLILNPTGVDVPIVGRIWWRYWQPAADRPRYPVGAWLGRHRRDEDWTVLPARQTRFELAATFDTVPLVVPWLGSPPDMPPDPPAQAEPCEVEDHLGRKMKMASWFDVANMDRDEMGVDWELDGDGTRWTRYQFSCVPLGTTLLFRQGVGMPDSHDTISKMVHSAADPTLAKYGKIGIARDHIYHTETTVTMAAHAVEQVPPPLWLFLLTHDERQRSAVHSFWSLERDPRCIPDTLIVSPTPQYERAEGTLNVPLAKATQVLGNLTFIMQTKMYTQVMELSDDDVLALGELQESRYFTTSGPDYGRSASCGLDHVTQPLRCPDTKDDGCSESSDDTESPLTDSEYYDAEEYQSATETSRRCEAESARSHSGAVSTRDRSYVPVRAVGCGHSAVTYNSHG